MGLPAGARPINAAGGVAPPTNKFITSRQVGSAKNIGRDPRFVMITPERDFDIKTAQGRDDNKVRYKFNVPWHSRLGTKDKRSRGHER